MPAQCRKSTAAVVPVPELLLPTKPSCHPSPRLLPSSILSFFLFLLLTRSVALIFISRRRRARALLTRAEEELIRLSRPPIWPLTASVWVCSRVCLPLVVRAHRPSTHTPSPRSKPVRTHADLRSGVRRGDGGGQACLARHQRMLGQRR